jgi:transforming growth factor-beta-induced protein
MRNFKSWALLAVITVFGAVFTGCLGDKNPAAPEMTNTLQPASPLTGDIVDTAIGAGVFNTLVAAVQAADLEGALRSEGPFTVFAPTDAAFDKLPEGLVAKLLLPQNKEKLKELLLYHVVSGRVLAKDLKWTQLVPTLEGQSLWIRKFWGTVLVNNARVTSADVLATNGVIHVINEVLIPKGFELEPDAPTADIVDTAISAGAFNTLVAAAQAAELVDALRGDGPLTVFAPTDEAFGKLPSELVSALLLPENKTKLQQLLLYHVVSGQVLSKDLKFYQRVATLQGGQLSIVKWFGNVWVNFSRVTTADVLATNGVIHVVNRVLIPQGFTLETNGVQFDKAGLDALVEANDPQEAPPTKAEMESMQGSN